MLVLEGQLSGGWQLEGEAGHDSGGCTGSEPPIMGSVQAATEFREGYLLAVWP